ncbi:hypothetical protein ACTFIN_01685 [Clostridium cagae]|uniref:hypothetical protein n=1 Tax=Clostridium cagae TaxID=2080751 RepID=UPI003F758B4F
MKIYKAQLTMYMDFEKEDEYEAKFTFDSDNEEYEENIKLKHWYRGCGWIGYKIPMNIELQPTVSGLYKAVQGFTKELNENEITNLKHEMATVIINQLKTDKEDYILRYNNKINILHEIK